MNTFQPRPKRTLFSEVRWECVSRLHGRNQETTAEVAPASTRCVEERSILIRDRGRRRPPTGRPPAIGPRAPPSSRSGARERMGRGSRRARLVRRRWRPHRPQVRRPLTAGNFLSAPPAFACSLPTRDSSRRKRKIPAYAGGFRPATVLSFPWPFVGVIRSPLCLDRCRTLPVSTRSLSWT